MLPDRRVVSGAADGRPLIWDPAAPDSQAIEGGGRDAPVGAGGAAGPRLKSKCATPVASAFCA
jgi:hypothetical protein